MGQGLMRECRALSERGPKALKGSEGPRRMYVQRFVERVQVYGSTVTSCNPHATSLTQLQSFPMLSEASGTLLSFPDTS